MRRRSFLRTAILATMGGFMGVKLPEVEQEHEQGQPSPSARQQIEWEGQRLKAEFDRDIQGYVFTPAATTAGARGRVKSIRGSEITVDWG